MRNIAHLTIERLKFEGFPFDNLNEKEFIASLNYFINEPKVHIIAVLNANKIYLLKRDPELACFLSQADLILPENALNLAFLLRGRPLKQWNMGGLPMMKRSLQEAAIHGWPLFFLGAQAAVVEKMVSRLSTLYPALKIAGYHHGYFKSSEESDLVEKINRSQAQLLFLGLGSPFQEKWMARHRSQLKVRVMMGVGGSFKVLAGIEKEAPSWTKFGLEWLYRTLQEPAKIKRYLVVNSLFLWLLVKSLFHSGK